MASQAPQTYAARWIFPVTAPPLPHGTITIWGDSILSVDPHGARPADVDLGAVAILPGFVNAHTHLDLTAAHGCCPPTPDFTRWLRQVIAYRKTRTPEQTQADIAAGLAQCLAAGTTLIGDISAAGASIDLLARAACRSVVFFELLGLSSERAATAWESFQNWRRLDMDNAATMRGISPHAPYSVRSSLFEYAGQQELPVATHLAESQAEVDLLHHRAGPFVDFLKEVGAWDPSGLVIQPDDVLCLLPHGIMVHGNYLDSQTSFTPAQSLVVCPRTHAAFDHPRHPFPGFLQRGARVALGTDSLASNPDLDVLAEARFLRRHYSEVEPAALLRMLTLSGAEALGFGAITGSLTPGKSADMGVFPLPEESKADPHDLIFESMLPVQRVMFRGAWA